jgi:hypothetical protein
VSQLTLFAALGLQDSEVKFGRAFEAGDCLVGRTGDGVREFPAIMTEADRQRAERMNSDGQRRAEERARTRRNVAVDSEVPATGSIIMTRAERERVERINSESQRRAEERAGMRRT